MLYHSILKRCCVSLLCLVGLTATAVPRVETMNTSDGDVITIDYEVTESNGEVTVCFINASVKFGQKNKKYSSAKDKNAVKIFFVDGKNYEDGYVVESEKGQNISVQCFTTPAGWSYDNKGAQKSHIFPINDTGACQLVFKDTSMHKEKRELKIPIYLAVYEYKGERKLLGLGYDAEIKYKVFSDCGTFKVDLPIIKTIAASSTSKKSGGDSPAPKEDEYEDVIIDNGSDASSFTTAEIDQRARELMNKIRPQLDACQTEDDFNQLEIDMGNLEKYWPNVSSSVQNEIDKLKSDYNERKAAAQQAAAEKQAAEQAKQDSIANEEAKKADDINRKDKWWMFIIAAVLGIIGFGGSQLSQHLRNKKNQQSMMDMQRDVVKRAESEAKRRAQSYARNKAHQVVGQATQKGRQALRSGVNRVGENVRGRQRANGDNPIDNGKPAGNAPVNRNKKNNNNGGGITI